MTTSGAYCGPGRPVIELEFGITVYPARVEHGRWRAVWYEEGERRHCEAVTEDRLAGRLEMVTERLRADAPNMKRTGADLMVASLERVARGEAVERPQADEGVTYARKIRPKDTEIRWDRAAARVDGQIRGLSPAPGAWFMAPSERGSVRVKALLSALEAGAGAPGEVLDDGLLIACSEGAVRILRLQREGRAAQDAESFLRGFPLAVGARLA